MPTFAITDLGDDKRATPPSDSRKPEVTGSLARIIFQRDGFLIATLSTGVTVKGQLARPQFGLTYRFRGKWRASRWGEQLDFDECEAQLPTDGRAVREYLRENCKWVGPEIGQRLVDRFGADTLSICKDEPELVAAEIPGLTLERARQVAAMLRSIEEDEQLKLDLKRIVGDALVTRRQVSEIIKEYGKEAPERIRENPYALIDDINGIGFLTADRIALGDAVGFDPKGLPRRRAAVVHALKEAARDEGHVCVPRAEVVRTAGAQLFAICSDEEMAEAVATLLNDGTLAHREDRLIYLRRQYENEATVAERLVGLIGGD